MEHPMSTLSMSPTQVDSLLIPLKGKLSIAIDESGFWYQEGIITRFIRWLRGSEDQRILSIVNIVNNTFDKIEQKSIKFYTDKQKITNYKSEFKRYFNLYQELVDQITNLGKFSSTLNRAHQLMKRKLIGLKYRLEGYNGGIDIKKTSDKKSLDMLITMASDWKKRQMFAIPTDLVKEEIAQLEKTDCYDKWTGLLQDDLEYQDEFFNWALRDHNPVDSFIQFPATQKKIFDASLSDYLGRIRDVTKEEIICVKKIKSAGIEKKILSLPFYHGGHRVFDANKLETINILNPEKIVTFLKGNYSLKLAELWKISSERATNPVNINVGPYGLENSHPSYGYWDSEAQKYVSEINFQKDDWYHDAIPTQLISRSIIEKKYSGKTKENTIFIRVTSSRGYNTLIPLKCHAGQQLIIPFGKENYKVIDISKYADPYPSSAIGQALAFAGTSVGKLSFLEQNGNDRQYAKVAIFPNEKDLNLFLENLKKDLELQLIFQAGAGTNCSGDTQCRLNKTIKDQTIPDLFSVNPMDLPFGFWPLDIYFKLLSFFPDIIQYYGFKAFLLIIGASRSMIVIEKGENVKKSVFNYYQRLEQGGITPFSLPSVLHEKISKRELEGELCWGNVESGM